MEHHFYHNMATCVKNFDAQEPENAKNSPRVVEYTPKGGMGLKMLYPGVHLIYSFAEVCFTTGLYPGIFPKNAVTKRGTPCHFPTCRCVAV